MKVLKRFCMVFCAVSLCLSLSLVCFADMPMFGEPVQQLEQLEQIEPIPDDIPQTATPLEGTEVTEEQPPPEPDVPMESLSPDYTDTLVSILDRLSSIDETFRIFVYGCIPVFSAALLVYMLLKWFKGFFTL